MKKNYETPALELLLLKTGEFLSTSGDATVEDPYDDGYGETFS